jgi:hypothetical protein
VQQRGLAYAIAVVFWNFFLYFNLNLVMNTEYDIHLDAVPAWISKEAVVAV